MIRTVASAPARRIATTVVAFGLALAAAIGLAAPASAASRIAPPTGFSCDSSNRTLAVMPARIWASYRTEQIGWGNHVERWDASRQAWAPYRNYVNYASFDYFGMAKTYWIGDGRNAYGSYINSRLRLRVNHAGYYRITAVIMGNQGGVRHSALIAGGAFCYMY